ncbi:hypothetical protein [Nocardiopsis ganjiahuensis]|uniref:hypothetical protein n=1 Tax=Nocardiopsis ganjiahuensis TaxID=239984 RepID=UPI00034BEDF0|nr:hypothetical protein [Nocardiopsis ganjiahuensis]
MATGTRPQTLIVGRSALPLTGAVEILRARGYGANATNQFDRVLDDYDATDLDLVIFGGQVPPALRTHLETAISERNPRTRFLSGLGGLAPLLAAQVEEYTHGTPSEASYDHETRTLHLTLSDTTRVVVTGLWAEAVPPEPIPHTFMISDGELPVGAHAIALPEEVPDRGAFVSVRIGERTSVLRIGPAPRPSGSATPQALPAPEPVTTRYPWTR